MRTRIYIDGYNLYYGSLKNQPYKWLNPELLCKNILSPKNKIEFIKYFTARVKPRPDDANVTNRQAFYLRALSTIPNLQIIYGKFLTATSNRKLSKPLEVLIPNPFGGKIPKTIHFVDVLETNEKGSDVNLATEMLIDGIEDKYDVAVIISNDSDLLAPILYVKKTLKKPVLILNPHFINPNSICSNQLKNNATKLIDITHDHLQASLFPEQLSDKQGIFYKPSKW